jgi:hypothetical protein
MVAFYCGFAELTNEVYHRIVLPLGTAVQVDPNIQG